MNHDPRILQFIDLLINTWTGYQIMIQQGFGGVNSKEKGDHFFLNNIIPLLIDHKSTDEYDFNDLLYHEIDTWLLQDMNTELDDSSIDEICQLLTNVHMEYINNEFHTLNTFMHKYKHNITTTTNSISTCIQLDEEEEDEDEDEDDDEDDEDQDQDEENNEEGWYIV